MMPTFYHEHNLRAAFNEPQFTRMRHRFRGVRESEKVNLEINQLRYAMQKGYRRYQSFQDNFVEKATTLLEGGELEADNETLAGLEDIAVRISLLRRRIEALEAK